MTQNHAQAQRISSAGLNELRQIHKLFVALRDDLERSGMIDIAVTRDDGPSVVITLDKRFVAGPALEILHTSEFTIVGKVTNTWRSPDDVANLYRRSVVSLLPALAQTVTWGLLTLLAGLARGMPVAEMEGMAYDAAGVKVDPGNGTAGGPGPEPTNEQERITPATESHDEGSTNGEPAADDARAESDSSVDEVLFGDELLAAVTPIVAGPAFQILPLAICS
jgi:hypothetical protein